MLSNIQKDIIEEIKKRLEAKRAERGEKTETPSWKVNLARLLGKEEIPKTIPLSLKEISAGLEGKEEITEEFVRELKGDSLTPFVGTTQEDGFVLGLKEMHEQAKKGNIINNVIMKIPVAPRKVGAAALNALGWAGERLSRATIYPIFATLEKLSSLEFKEIPSAIGKAFKGEAGDPMEVIYRSLSKVMPEKTAKAISIPLGLAGSFVFDPLTYTGVGTVKKISKAADTIKALRPLQKEIQLAEKLYDKGVWGKKLIERLEEIRDTMRAGGRYEEMLKRNKELKGALRGFTLEEIKNLGGAQKLSDYFKFLKVASKKYDEAKNVLESAGKDIDKLMKMIEDRKYFEAGIKKISIAGIPLKPHLSQKIADAFKDVKIGVGKSIAKVLGKSTAEFYDKAGMFLPDDEKAVLEVFRNLGAASIHSRRAYTETYIASRKILDRIAKKYNIEPQKLNDAIIGFINTQREAKWEAPFRRTLSKSLREAKIKLTLEDRDNIIRVLDTFRKQDEVEKIWRAMGFLPEEFADGWFKIFEVRDIEALHEPLEKLYGANKSLFHNLFGVKNADEFIKLTKEAIQKHDFLYLQLMRNGMALSFKSSRQLALDLQRLPFIATQKIADNYVELKGRYLEGLWAPAHIADYIYKKIHTFMTPQVARTHLAKFIEHFNDIFRKNILGYFPSWMLRNVIGNFWNMSLEGFNVLNPKHWNYLKQAVEIMNDTNPNKIFKTATGMKLTYRDLRRILAEENIYTAGLSAEVGVGAITKSTTIREALGLDNPSFLKKAFRTTLGGNNPITWAMFKANEFMENNARIALALKVLEETGDIKKASEIVNKVLFNYAVPAGSYDPLIRRYSVFWNWYRNNIVYQFSKIAEHPKILSGVYYPTKVGEFASLTPEPNLIPPYLLKQYWIPLFKTTGIVLENLLPFVDLNYFVPLHPKIPLTGDPEIDETIQKYNAFSGMPLVEWRIAQEEFMHPLHRAFIGLRKLKNKYAPAERKLWGVKVHPFVWTLLMNSPWSRLAYTTNLLLSKEARERAHTTLLESIARFVSPVKPITVNPYVQFRILQNTTDAILRELSVNANRAWLEGDVEEAVKLSYEISSLRNSLKLWRQATERGINIFADPAHTLQEQIMKIRREQFKEFQKSLRLSK